VKPLAPLARVLLAGCVAHVPATGDIAQTVQYDCGGYRFSAQYGSQMAILMLPDGRSLNLRQTVAASGTRYTDGTNTLTEQGGSARLELQDAVHNQCSAQ
jgi:membrane-bound inhibitor of C-type lysozyme